MAKTSQAYADRDEQDRLYEGPDQDPPAAVMSVAMPLLAEVVAVLLMFACALVWCGLGAGRI